MLLNQRPLNVYICSAGHSGSTLLDMVLGAHSKMTSLGEIVQLPKNLSLNTLCTCGSSVRSCIFWREVIRKVNSSLKIDAMRNPYELNLGFTNPQVIKDSIHKSKVYGLKRRFFKGLLFLELRFRLGFLRHLNCPVYDGMKNLLVLYDIVSGVSGSDVTVDSSKGYLEAVGLYLMAPERVRIIILHRDGRGVFYSYLKRGFRRSYSLNAWKKHYSRALHLLEKHVEPSAMIRVRYEDLIRDTESEVRRICKFLGVKYEADMLDFASHVNHITNGNDMRFIGSSRLVLDNKWKVALSGEDLAYFEKKAGFLNRKLGYI